MSCVLYLVMSCDCAIQEMQLIQHGIQLGMWYATISDINAKNFICFQFNPLLIGDLHLSHRNTMYYQMLLMLILSFFSIISDQANCTRGGCT